jgi:RNA polymerase sigma factor for flagellar operon FliA
MTTTKVVSIDAGGHRERVIRRRDELALAHLSLVDGLARSVRRCLPPSFDLDDLVGVGLIALLDAAMLYRPAEYGGVPFSAYARKGIRGAMLESVRRKRYTENTRPGLEVVFSATRDLSGEAGGSVGCSKMPRAIETYALDRAATQPVAEDALDSARLRKRVTEAISTLPRRHAALLGLLYGVDEPTVGQVAKSLGIPRHEAMDLHAEAIHLLKARLTGGALEKLAA